MPDSLEQRLVGVGRQGHLPSSNLTERRADQNPNAVFLDGQRFGVFVNANTQLLGGTLETPCQPRRVDNCGPVFSPQPTGVGGTVDLSAHPLGIEQFDLLPKRSQLLKVILQFGAVVRSVIAGGDIDHAGALVVAIDVVALDGRFDLVEVLQAQLFEQRQFLRESFLAVGNTVGEARLHKPAVTAAGRRPDLVGVNQHDISLGVAFFRDDCGPQSGVTTANNAQVTAFGTHQRGIAIGLVSVVVPIRIRIRIGYRIEMEFVDRFVVITVVDRHGFTTISIATLPTTVAGVDLQLQSRRAVVAAASGGLGFASAQALANEGASVAICGRDAVRIQDAAQRIGHGCIAMVHDVSTGSGARAFVEAAADALGGIDILVANGGGPPGGNYAETPYDRYQAALEQSLLSVVAMCQAAIPMMQQQQWGRIVAITSLSVRQPIANLILSNTARAGVTGFLKTVAREIAAHGITVNSVQPGLHATDRIAALYGENADVSQFGVPAGFIGHPDDFGSIVTFLCSDQAKYITGVQLNVDGGSFAGLQ